MAGAVRTALAALIAAVLATALVAAPVAAETTDTSAAPTTESAPSGTTDTSTDGDSSGGDSSDGAPADTGSSEPEQPRESTTSSPAPEPPDPAPATTGASSGAPVTASATTPPLSPARGVYPSWTIDPSDTAAKDHTGTITFGVKNFPDAVYSVVKSNDDGFATGLIPNNSDWLAADTPFGQVFGASGPSVTTLLLSTRMVAGTGRNAVTTITFSKPVASGTLGIAVGDIDVDNARIEAFDANDVALTGAQLAGGAFNFCDSTDAPSACPTSTGGPAVAGFDVPVWNPVTQTCVGNTVETVGASCWFRPTAALSKLVVTYTPNPGSGFPLYRLWLATLKSNTSGAVEFEDTPRVPGTYQLIAPDGSLVQEGALGPNGEFAVADVSSQNGYVLRVTLADGETREVTVGLASGDVFTVLTFGAPEPTPTPEPTPPVHPSADAHPSGSVTLASFGTLPATGFEAGVWAVLALVMLVAGAAFVGATRRRDPLRLPTL